MNTIFCCKRNQPAKEFHYKNDESNLVLFLECCEKCKSRTLITNLGRISGKKAKIIFESIKNQLKEIKEIIEKPTLSFVPLKYYESVNKESQKEMYLTGNSTGFKFTSFAFTTVHYFLILICLIKLNKKTNVLLKIPA